MQTTAMMMMGVLTTASAKPEVPVMSSEAFPLLDFRKAYNTVLQDFILVTLTRFGLSPIFTTMIRGIHTEATAHFLVNGELSTHQEVISGIRQGCPLAPL